DYARRSYYVALIDTARPDANAVGPIIAQLNEKMKSDYERGQVLQKIAAQVKLDQRAATAYVNAVSPMKSDYERRRALAAVLGLRPLPTGVAELAMRSAADMKSDYEKSELLRTALQTKTVERGDALLEAMRQMQSAYEKRRVLTEALAVEPLSADLK